MAHITSSEIINNIGESVFIEQLGFTKRNLRHIRREGVFPGYWYASVKALCEKHGVYCSMTAFAWKEPEKKRGNAGKDIQGASQ